MRYLKLFEDYNGNSEVIQLLEKLIEGFNISVSDLGVIEDYFDGEIPVDLLYQGIVYRFVFFDNVESYNKCLKEGLQPRHNSFLRCAKSLDSQDIIIEQLGTGYEYYIIFECESTLENSVLDINATCEYFNFDNVYEHEEEVLIESKYLSVDNIIEHGEI
jgi:hypothetical protein